MKKVTGGPDRYLQTLLHTVLSIPKITLKK